HLVQSAVARRRWRRIAWPPVIPTAALGPSAGPAEFDCHGGWHTTLSPQALVLPSLLAPIRVRLPRCAGMSGAGWPPLRPAPFNRGPVGWHARNLRRAWPSAALNLSPCDLF